jgi:hypothetical protein
VVRGNQSQRERGERESKSRRTREREKKSIDERYLVYINKNDKLSMKRSRDDCG